MRRAPLTLAIAAVLASASVLAQDVGNDPALDGARTSVPLSYVGSDTRLSLGIDDDGNVLGEILKIFGNDGDSSWLAQGWLGHGGAGGVQLDYHWLRGGSLDDAITRAGNGSADKLSIGKAFVALDQNAFEDRKASIGLGWEKENLSVDAYLSAGITGRRPAGTSSSSIDTILTGVENGRPFTQTQTVTTTTRLFDRPYDWGIGARVGRFFEGPLARLRGGLDYERGDSDADQFTLALGVDKYFRNSGHSLSLELERYERDGPVITDSSETRAWLLWRYEIGQSFRETEPTRRVEVRTEGEPSAMPEPVVVRNEVRMDAEAMFGLDRATLTDDASAELAAMVDAINSDRRISRVSVIGHTCDLGSDAYNQALSERRAATVRQFLEAHGVAVAEMDVSGVGEKAPRYPNDGEENRSRNRRVAVSFLTVETHVTEPEAPPPPESKIEWVREAVPAPAPWIERAMRNPAQHKRTVDVYRVAETSDETTLGPREFQNQGPVAQNDSLAIDRDAPATPIAVLANDSDPDGDMLTITTVSTPANGTATIAGAAINYTPAAGFVGVDTFVYAISDGHGGTAQATVMVTVNDGIPPDPENRAPIAVDDFMVINANSYAIVEALANDSDPDGDPITIVAVGTPIYGGSVRINSGVNILYVPLWRWWGIEEFTYTIRDSHGAEATATIRVRVVDD
jgi:outer membrane protein OmpA-like peptidoglycan-associated protein